MIEDICIVLNSDYSFLNIVSIERAFLYITKEKVIVEKYTEKFISTAEETFKIPKVVRFVKLIKQVFSKKIPWSRQNVIVRDQNTCQYCGQKPKKLTIDHVIPKSRGGKNTFQNTVAACFQCNNIKADRTPQEAGMAILSTPEAPTVSLFIRMNKWAYSNDMVMKELGFI